MIATLTEVLSGALTEGYAVPGFVVLGWEDAVAYVRAGEAENRPVILQAGPGCRAHTPIPILGVMFRHLADVAEVPVVAHLDHATTLDECKKAIEAGFSSVMFDGSRLSLDENIRRTEAVSRLAEEHGVSVEGEIGFVGYDAGETSIGTDPEEARIFAERTRVDALAVSVGNIHLQRETDTAINFNALRAIEAATDLPLVIHGGSGIPVDDCRRLATETSVCKLNIGTELRQVFGAALRSGLDRYPHRFDRIEILNEVVDPMTDAAIVNILRLAPRKSGLD
jgi:fructose-bisphosphate aldolase class II